MLAHRKTASASVSLTDILQGKKIIRAGYVNVKGSSFTSRFTRQWLSLTEEELFFSKDSTLAPHDSIRCRDVITTTPTNTRRHCVTLNTKQKKVFLSFKTALELKDWTQDLWICNRPVIIIGSETYDYEKTLTGDDMYRDHSPLFDKHPNPFPVLSKSVSNLHLYLDKPLPSISGSSSQSSSFSRLDLFNWSARHRDSRSDVSTILTDGEMPLFIDTELSPVPTDFTTSPVFDIQGLGDISSSVEVLDKTTVTTVSFTDSRRGKWSDGVHSRIVAIKSLRALPEECNKTLVEQRLLKHLEKRRMTRNRNVLNLMGYIRDSTGCLSMVTPWSYNGNLADYLAGKGSGSSMLLRLRLLCQAAAGLQYLHDFEPPIVHGDVKAANILINDEGEAVVSNMGIAPLINETASSNSTTGSRLSFTSPLFSELHRWMAFELLQSDLDEEGLPSSTSSSSHRSRVTMLPPCDIWSYGSTVLEVMSGNIPYHHHSDNTQVLRDIKQGIKPRIDTRAVSQPLVNFIQSCWTEDPESRPSATAITQTMTRIYEQS